jgi:hypothetical protein
MDFLSKFHVLLDGEVDCTIQNGGSVSTFTLYLSLSVAKKPEIDYISY